jgi:hypothetical protein
MERLPNRIYPQGIRLKLSDMAEAFAKGRKLLSSQTYEIKNSVGEGDLLAVECPGRANWPWHWDPGYRHSQRKRKRIEECFGWLKTIALPRKVRHRGVCKVDWIFTFACAAYNLVRIRNLATVPAG